MTAPAPRPFARTILWVAGIGVAGAVGLELARPDKDNLPTVAALLAFLGSILAFLKAEATHLSVNSRLDDMMKHAEDAARGEGITEERARADAAKEETP